MNRSGPGVPIWAFVGFGVGLAFAVWMGYVISLVDDGNAVAAGAVMAGGFAAGGAVVGGVRDVLAYLHCRLPAAAGRIRPAGNGLSGRAHSEVAAGTASQMKNGSAKPGFVT
jgi:hypothetical protein